MRIPLAYKFIIGFLAVVAAVTFTPFIVDESALADELKSNLKILVALVIGLLLGLLFSRGFSKRFTYFTRLASRISLGDLSFNANERAPRLLFKDETNDLEDALGLLFSNLRGLILNLKETTRRLSEAQSALSELIAKGKDTNTEVISSSSKIFESALEQARHAETTAAMVKEVASFAEDVSTKVADTLAASRQAHTMVEKGSTVSNAAIEKLEDIFEGLYKTESAATHLKERINDIPRVLDVITHISRQTDLLALNATIEASKAGEHGKGFALVAEEVRRFAESTNKSVEDVSQIVRELKNDVERVVANVANSSTYIKDGRDDIRKIRDIFSEIENYTSDVSSKADIIIDLANRQRTKASHTVTIIDDLASIAQSNLTTTESLDQSIESHGTAIEATVEASRKLSELSKELESATSRFTVEQGFEDQAAAAIDEVVQAALDDEPVAEPEISQEEPVSYVAEEQPSADETPLIQDVDIEAPAEQSSEAPQEAAADEPWLSDESTEDLGEKPSAITGDDTGKETDTELPPAPWEEDKKLSIEDLTREDKDA